MKKGPKPKYCYVCRVDGPCSGDAPCNRLSKEKKAEAYRIGYYARHGKQLLKKAKERYRILTAPASLEREQERKRLLDEIEDKRRLIRDETYKQKIAVLNDRLQRLQQRADKIESRSQAPRQARSKADPDPEAEKARVRNRNRNSENLRRAEKGMKLREAKEVRQARWEKLREEKGDKRTRWRNTLRLRAIPKLVQRCRCEIERSADAKRESFRKELYALWESVDQSKTVKQIRKEAHAIRMAQAQARYEESIAILEEYAGRKPRYETPEAFAASRKRYMAAYASVHNRKPHVVAKNRDSYARDRINPRPRSGAPEFYRRMLLAVDIECFYCHKDLSVEDRCGDHYIPLAKGGLHHENNLVVACYACNSAKSDKMPEEFRPTVVRVNQVVTMRGEQERLFA